jgi:hypothetical protein
MLPPSYFIPWGPGALYAELYLGLCRALVAPWLCPPRLDRAPAAPSCAPAQCRSPSELAAAEPSDDGASAAQPSAAAWTAALAENTSEPDSTGAAIIPFDRARARLSRGPAK